MLRLEPKKSPDVLEDLGPTAALRRPAGYSKSSGALWTLAAYFAASVILLSAVPSVLFADAASDENQAASEPADPSETKTKGSAGTAFSILNAPKGFAKSLHRPADEGGPVIRRIIIEVRDVFDDTDSGWLYRTANSLKINTREEVVRRELLFAEGEVYDQFLIDESVRNLRTLPFLREAAITPTYSEGQVDILVSVQDTWTLYPLIGFSSGSGNNRRMIGVNEGNIAGFGKRLGMLYGDDDGSTVMQGYYDDRRLLGTNQRLTSAYLNRSDGYLFSNFIGRPFRSLVDPYSWRLTTNFSDLVDKQYKDSSTDFIYREEATDIDGGVSLSRGDPEVLLWRYSLGYGYTKHLFTMPDAQDFEDVDEDPAVIDQDPSRLADDRRFSGPQISFERIETDFISASFIDRFERVEDFNLGNVFGTFIQYSPQAFVSDKDYALFGLTDTEGLRLSESSFIRGVASVRGRTDFDHFENIIFSADLRYYNTLGLVQPLGIDLGNHTLASSLSIDDGEELDRDRQFLLGADNGLRGYHARLFDGDQLLLFNLEDRFFVAEDVLHLFNFGGAIFFDAGGTSDSGLGQILDDELRTDIGVGLRIGLPRSSGSTVVRIDLAFPLRRAADGTDPFSPRLMITTGQAFLSYLPGEAATKEDTNPFTVGINP